ncbi:MAG: hypothetical protein ACRYFS_26250 [Janthinobacterium lividum]
MSLVTLRQSRQNDVEELKQRLTDEFVHPANEYAAPFINIERPGTSTHLLVVWDEWRDLSQQERSSMILRAYEAANGIDAAIEVSVAMGLTVSEAERLGFDLEPA